MPAENSQQLECRKYKSSHLEFKRSKAFFDTLSTFQVIALSNPKELL